MTPTFVTRCVGPLIAALTVACGSSAELPDVPGADSGNPSSGGLRPGEAGNGRLAYLIGVPGGFELEITNLTTGTIEYRSNDDDDGTVQRFVLSADGSTAAFQTPTSPCTRVSLPSGAKSNCTPDGLVVPELVGISNDGTRIGFIGLRTGGSSGSTVASILQGSTLTDVATGSTSEVMSGSGAVSPSGDAFYTFAIDPSGGGSTRLLALTKHSVEGSPEVVFGFSAGVHSFGLLDTTLQLSEDGTRGLFRCGDPSRAVFAEQNSTCSVDLQTGSVVLYPNAFGTLSLDGSALITIPQVFAEGFSVYAFGSATPTATVTQEGIAPALSPDASRIGFRIRTDDAFQHAATRPVGAGAPVLVQRGPRQSRVPPNAALLWRR